MPKTLLAPSHPRVGSDARTGAGTKESGIMSGLVTELSVSLKDSAVGSCCRPEHPDDPSFISYYQVLPQAAPLETMIGVVGSVGELRSVFIHCISTLAIEITKCAPDGLASPHCLSLSCSLSVGVALSSRTAWRTPSSIFFSSG